MILERARRQLYRTHVFQERRKRLGIAAPPLEAMACGTTPVSNVYGGLSDPLGPAAVQQEDERYSLLLD
jgi:glycogen synthase